MDDRRIGGGRFSTRFLVPFLLIILAGGLVYLAWWSTQPPVRQTVRLPDGTRISLAAVTYGTVHQYDPEPPLFRLARGWKLPKPVQDVATITTAQPETRAWIYVARTDTADPNSDVFAVFEDEHGCPFDAGQMEPQGWSNDQAFWGAFKPSPPLNHGHGFDLCGYDKKLRTEVLRFHHRPSVSPPLMVRQALSPQSLPLTVVSHGWRATLASLKAIPAPDEPHYRARIRGVAADGSTMSPISLAVEDQYGRRMESMPADKHEELSGEGFAFYGLCRLDPVWKLVATMAREYRPGSAPDVRWEVELKPANGVTVTRGRAKDTLEVSHVGSTPVEIKGSKKKVNLVRFYYTASPRKAPSRMVLLQVNGRDPRPLAAAVFSTDDDMTQPFLEFPVTPEGEWSGSFAVPLEQVGKKVRLTIGEYAGQRAEFVVRPPQPGT